ncbi:MAG: hypothetical protein Q9202_006783 [Teloschistes flavicans]
MVFGGGYPQNTIMVNFHNYQSCVYRTADLRLVPVPPETDKMTGGRVLLGRQSYTEASQRDTCHSDNCNTGSEQCLTLAARWLNMCTANHTTCERPRPFADRNWQPSRLVYTGNEDDDVLRLCERQMIPPRVRYTTLSHCWGTGIDRKTLKLCNLDAWKREIPKDEVMETFKDAIKVTRSFGLQYIWIDSICIVQDSKDDWLHESKLMSNVYKYSYCNISATAASNDTIGLFCERDPSVDLPVCFQSGEEGVFSPKEMYRSLAKGFPSRRILEGPYQICWDVEKLAREIESESPLCRRAWVVQERLLASRILHFAKTEVYWECNEFQASESYADGLPEEQKYTVKSKAINPCNLRMDYPSDTLQDRSLQEQRETAMLAWETIVDAYSRCELTNAGDKLIAISAIAREIQPLMQCRYIAGLWEFELVRQLFWQVRGGGTRPTTYRAPSWAWPSVDGPIETIFANPNAGFRELVDMSVHIDLQVNDDEMGPVKGGYLDIHGQLLPMEYERVAEHDYSKTYYQDVLIQVLAKRVVFRLDDEYAVLEGPLYFMPMYFQAPEDPELWGLALQQADAPGVYKRLGCFNLWRERSVSIENNPIYELLGKFEGDPESGYTFTRNELGRQNFRIV